MVRPSIASTDRGQPLYHVSWALSLPETASILISDGYTRPQRVVSDVAPYLHLSYSHFLHIELRENDAGGVERISV